MWSTMTGRYGISFKLLLETHGMVVGRGLRLDRGICPRSCARSQGLPDPGSASSGDQRTGLSRGPRRCFGGAAYHHDHRTGDSAIRVRAEQLGVRAFLDKPVTEGTLLASIPHALGQA